MLKILVPELKIICSKNGGLFTSLYHGPWSVPSIWSWFYAAHHLTSLEWPGAFETLGGSSTQKITQTHSHTRHPCGTRLLCIHNLYAGPGIKVGHNSKIGCRIQKWKISYSTQLIFQFVFFALKFDLFRKLKCLKQINVYQNLKKFEVWILGCSP